MLTDWIKVIHCFWGCLWRFSWKRLVFDSVDNWIKEICLQQCDQKHQANWRAQTEEKHGRTVRWHSTLEPECSYGMGDGDSPWKMQGVWVSREKTGSFIPERLVLGSANSDKKTDPGPPFLLHKPTQRPCMHKFTASLPGFYTTSGNFSTVNIVGPATTYLREVCRFQSFLKFFRVLDSKPICHFAWEE